jgi:hypothetical protein
MQPSYATVTGSYQHIFYGWPDNSLKIGVMRVETTRPKTMSLSRSESITAHGHQYNTAGLAGQEIQDRHPELAKVDS